MIINKEEYTLLERLIEIRNIFELKKHTPEIVSLLISDLRWPGNLFSCEQKKKILYFVNEIVHKYFEFDKKKKNSLEKKTNSFFRRNKRLRQKHTEFVHLPENLEDGIIYWGMIIDMIPIVIKIIEQGEHIEHIELSLALGMPVVAISSFSMVPEPEKFKKAGPYFARHLNEIIYDCIPKEIIEGAFLTGLLEKEHELKQGYLSEDIFYSVPKKEYDQAMQALVKGRVTPFVDFVKNYFLTSVSYHDIPQKKKEGGEPFYHNILLGMVSSQGIYHVRSNRESGHGRYDIALEPKKGMKAKAVIIELKVSREDEDMGKVAQEAFDQIQVKQYKADMEARGITEFVLLGMAFRGKEVAVATH